MADLLNSATISNLLGITPSPDTVPAMNGVREIDRPIEERLRYGTSFHQEILSRLTARQKLAERNIATRYDDWRRVDENTQLFIDLSRGIRNADKSTHATKKEMPWERAIVVPMSYAIEQTLLTQQLAIFTRRDPILEVSGVGPEDITPAKIMQAAIAYDQQQSQFLVQLYMIIRDAGRYGLAVLYDCWEETYGWKFTRNPQTPMNAFLGLPEVERKWDLLKQHNMVEAIDPRLAWIDPRVSISNGWRSEFYGHRVYCAYLDILEKSQANGGPYFNVEQVAKLGSGGITRRDTTAARSLKHLQMTGSMDQNDKGFHAKDVMNVRLIPRDWKLGDGERPEIWQFAWVDASVIIRAHRSQYDHQQLPYAGCESNVDTHVTFNPGDVELLDGLNRFANWQYNCFSSDTEILTRQGWKLFSHLTNFDEVATVSADDRRSLWYERPRQFFEYDFCGDMLQIGGGKNVVTDLLVTPNHQMWRARRKDRKLRKTVNGEQVVVYDQWCWSNYEFEDAAKLRAGDKIPNTISWDLGEDEGELIFEACPLKRPDKGNPKKRKHPRLVFFYEQLAQFIGWYVSEGSKTGNAISIKQKNVLYLDEIQQLMSSLPRHVYRYHDKKKDAYGWTLTDKRVAKWFGENCGPTSENKKLPKLIDRFNKRLLQILMNAALKGDGHKIAENLYSYSSTSKQLIDDMQIVALKLGWGTSVRCQKKPPGRKDAWHLYINTSLDGREVRKLEYVPYKGKVYCVENSTHLVLVRRNGKAVVCGQSHVQNVMRHLNNSMLYDPVLVEELDILNPTAAGHYRLSAIGSKLLQEGRITMDAVIHQLQKVDVTTPMLAEVRQLYDWGMRMTGASDAMQAQITQDKRTLGEVNQANLGASARMGFRATLIDAMSIMPMAMRWITNRQQFTDQPQFFRIAGDAARELARGMPPEQAQMLMQTGRLMVRPEDLQGNFDYVPRSGPQPADPGNSIQAWQILSETLAKSPALLQIPDSMGRVPDPQELFKEYARGPLGIRNIDSFYKSLAPPMPAPVTVKPDEEVQKERRRGNVVPLREAGSL